jgi:FkbM family methyltransferase
MESGYHRYIRLFQNVINPLAYWKDKLFPDKEMIFITKPKKISIRVPKKLLQIFKEIFLDDFYNIDLLKKELTKDSIVVDIGANVGFFSFLILSKIEVKKIYSFEPISTNIDFFKKIISENKVLQDKIMLKQAAVTGADLESLELFLDNTYELTENASVFAGYKSTPTIRVSVPSISLTKIFIDNDLDQIDFLKLDCEGSEFDIIYNTDPSILKRIKKIVVEIHDIEGDEKSNISYFNTHLQSVGFVTNSKKLNRNLHVLVANRK